jgi:hypothetical protein
MDPFADIPDPAGAPPPAPPPPVPAARSLTRAERTAWELAGLAASIGWIAATLGWVGLRPDLADPPVLAALALLGAGSMVVALVAFRAGRGGLPSRIGPLRGAVALAPVLLLAAIALVADRSVTAADRPCLLITTSMALGPLAIGAALLRRTFLSAPIWRGAALGGVAGLVAAAGIHLHCPHLGQTHLLVGHGAPVALCIAAGALYGARWGRV